MNKARRAAISSIRDQLDDLKSQVEEIQGEEQDYFDNMPENMQDGERGNAASEAASELECAVSALEEAIGNLENAEN
jgi:polyhydroxyalkanoate synthesis regulator phasin